MFKSIKILSLSSLFFIAIAAFSSSSIYAEGSNGIHTMKMTDSSFVVIDTNSKKILVYTISKSKGLLLKEVRSFDKALNAKNFTSSSGLTSKEEKAIKE